MVVNPLVSIIIPTYNREHLIGETLNSFVTQAFHNWEVIVVDDGSTDNTRNRLTDQIKDKRIKYFLRNDIHKKGPSGCRNFGLSKAKGELILFFDDDDIAHPDLLKEVVLAFSKQNLDFVRYERKVFYGNFHYQLDKTKIVNTYPINQDDLDKMITNKLPFNTCAVVWRREAIGNERFNESLFYSDEWEFFQRLLSNGLKGINLEKTLLYARKHPKSSTGYFLIKNLKYINSTRKAMMLVFRNVSKKGLLDSELLNFFLRKSFELKIYKLLVLSLESGNFNNFDRLKYKLGYKVYPVLKPIFYFKAKILKD